MEVDEEADRRAKHERNLIKAIHAYTCFHVHLGASAAANSARGSIFCYYAICAMAGASLKLFA